MSLEIKMTSVFYVKKTLRLTVSNKFYLFNPVLSIYWNNKCQYIKYEYQNVCGRFVLNNQILQF